MVDRNPFETVIETYDVVVGRTKPAGCSLLLLMKPPWDAELPRTENDEWSLMCNLKVRKLEGKILQHNSVSAAETKLRLRQVQEEGLLNVIFLFEDTGRYSVLVKVSTELQTTTQENRLANTCGLTACWSF
ncbi:hypothetical protein NPIL_380721 [Nephila pilipes]|uniref:Uncharacterized protein n=1 Tax=Nephila pilipes TaxID=299642 RepID=A0A8X6QDQ6_NEPPI|nr:hypothetical protein NPIL_380721 [Nephila pilipes]